MENNPRTIIWALLIIFEVSPMACLSLGYIRKSEKIWIDRKLTVASFWGAAYKVKIVTTFWNILLFLMKNWSFIITKLIF